MHIMKVNSQTCDMHIIEFMLKRLFLIHLLQKFDYQINWQIDIETFFKKGYCDYL